MKLSEPKSKEEFLKESQSQTVNSLSADSLTSLWSTVTLLAQSSSNTEQLSFVFPSLCVAPSISASSISKDQGGFIGELVRAAHATSNATASSSLLAGRSSESDEYGDVGLLLPFVEGNDRERKVLEILGLQGCIEDGGEVSYYLSVIIVVLIHEARSLPSILTIIYLLESL